jgi:hypothetical protein
MGGITEQLMKSDITGETWVTEDKSERAIWTIVHEVYFTEFHDLRCYLLTHSIAYPYGKVQRSWEI